MNKPMFQRVSREADGADLPSTGLNSALCEALRLMAQARQYADQLEESVWQFAVEHTTLRERGITNNDFRWLVCKEYVEHAREVTTLGQHVRSFRHAGGLVFTKRTCFVLTEPGFAFARQCRGQRRRRKMRRQRESSESRPVVAIHEPPMPAWDSDRREVRVGQQLVKQFKLPSANQEMILAAFQEEGWPVRIDDPLPQRPEFDPKRRLHDTIKGLNRHQKHRLLRFMGDGSGQGVRWELIQDADTA